jgi:hypothetical protein
MQMHVMHRFHSVPEVQLPFTAMSQICHRLSDVHSRRIRTSCHRVGCHHLVNGSGPVAIGLPPCVRSTGITGKLSSGQHVVNSSGIIQVGRHTLFERKQGKRVPCQALTRAWASVTVQSKCTYTQTKALTNTLNSLGPAMPCRGLH